MHFLTACVLTSSLAKMVYWLSCLGEANIVTSELVLYRVNGLELWNVTIKGKSSYEYFMKLDSALLVPYTLKKIAEKTCMA